MLNFPVGTPCDAGHMASLRNVSARAGGRWRWDRRGVPILAVAALLAVVSVALVSCSGSEPPSTPVTVVAPASTAVVEDTTDVGLSPELTRRAADTLRQRDHIATLIASRPTETPVLGEELNLPPPGVSSERGVWWYKPGTGDHSGAALLSIHPYGEALDLLDGSMDGERYPAIAAVNAERMLEALVDESVDLVLSAESESTGFLNRGQIGVRLWNDMERTMAWEVASTSEPMLRVWAEFDWQRIDGSVVTYRVGALGIVDVVPPDSEDSVSYRHVGKLRQVPFFSHYSDLPIIERVDTEG